MDKDKGRKRLPPYISYRTFQNFIEGLQQGIPARIDRSYWSDKLSGSTGIQLMSALRFMGLIDADGTPTNRLRLLASTRGIPRTEILKEITTEAFNFLMREGSFDLERSTYAQLQEAFHNAFELTDGVNRKCVKFFVEMAIAAGLPLSPFISKRLRSVRSGAGTKPSTRKKGNKAKWNLIVPQDLEEIPAEMSWNKILLAKFPTFDPTWTDEVKLKWFEAFDKLLERDSPTVSK